MPSLLVQLCCCRWVDIVEYKFEDHLDKVVVTVDGVDGADKLPPGKQKKKANICWMLLFCGLKHLQVVVSIFSPATTSTPPYRRRHPPFIFVRPVFFPIAGRVTCELEETAMVLKIRGVRYNKIQGGTGSRSDQLINLRMVCGELWGKILAQQSGESKVVCVGYMQCFALQCSAGLCRKCVPLAHW